MALKRVTYTQPSPSPSLLSSPSPLSPSRSLSSSSSLLPSSPSSVSSPAPLLSLSFSPSLSLPKRNFGGEGGMKLGEIQQAYTHLQQGRYHAAKQCLVRAEEILEAIGLHFSDNERLFVVSMILHVCKRSGDAEGLLQATNKYLSQKTAENTQEMKEFWKMMYGTRIFSYMMKGDYEAALDAVQPLEEFLKQQQQQQPQDEQQQQQQLHNDLTYLKLTEALLLLSSSSSPLPFSLNPVTLSFSVSLSSLPRVFHKADDDNLNLFFQNFWKVIGEARWMVAEASSSSPSFTPSKMSQIVTLLESRASLLSGDGEEALTHLKNLPANAEPQQQQQQQQQQEQQEQEEEERPTDVGNFFTFAGEEEGGWISEIFPITTWREQMNLLVCVGDHRWEDARVASQAYFKAWEIEKRNRESNNNKEGVGQEVGRVEELVEFVGSLHIAGFVEWHLDNRPVAEGLHKKCTEILTQLRQDPFSAPHRTFLNELEEIITKDFNNLGKKQEKKKRKEE